MKWFFKMGDDGLIHLMMRASGYGHDTLGPGEEIFGLTYDELAAAGAGVIEVDDGGRGRGRIARPRSSTR